MKILVTGYQGYIGSVLVQILKNHGFSVRGLDAGYYSECVLDAHTEDFEKIKRDIRDVNREDLKGIDAIIHLAALSNDPLGELDPHLTREINFEGTVKIAKLAKEVGVERFLYSSSQSMYGISENSLELDEDKSEKNPLTSYAAEKWNAEKELSRMSSDEFTVTSFRPSTVFGASPRLRCDIVFNNLVACAYTTGKIKIMSDGTPWRPVVHIKDVCSAFLAGLKAPASLISGKAYNVGILNGNFTVKEIAEAAQRAVPGSELVFTGEHTDPRSYRVSFKRILNDLKHYYKPEWDLERGGKELVEFFKSVKLTEEQFRGQQTMRLQRLQHLLQTGILNDSLRMS